jgi:hypothetical protein
MMRRENWSMFLKFGINIQRLKTLLEIPLGNLQNLPNNYFLKIEDL